MLQDKLFDLEARMIQTTSETAKQTTKVNKLQEKVRSTTQQHRHSSTDAAAQAQQHSHSSTDAAEQTQQHRRSGRHSSTHTAALSPAAYCYASLLLYVDECQMSCPMTHVLVLSAA
jgi:methyl-accepting chemotaxis protein